MKSLRRYHDMGLLEPANIDRETGYRYYETSQVPLGQAIRRFRETQQTVASLRALLEQPRAPIAVEYRSVAAVTALAISEPVHRGDIATWWSEAFGELHRVLAASSAARSGPDGALYPNEFFEEELGEVVAFIPMAGMPTPSGRPQLIEIPEAELAIAAHNGAISESQMGPNAGTPSRSRPCTRFQVAALLLTTSTVVYDLDRRNRRA